MLAGTWAAGIGSIYLPSLPTKGRIICEVGLQRLIGTMTATYRYSHSRRASQYWERYVLEKNRCRVKGIKRFMSGGNSVWMPQAKE